MAFHIAEQSPEVIFDIAQCGKNEAVSTLRNRPIRILTDGPLCLAVPSE
jgi:hypothetical protein